MTNMFNCKNCESLTKRYDSAQESMKAMAEKLNSQAQIINVLEEEKRQSVAMEITKNGVMQGQVGANDAKIKELETEIINLKEELKNK